MLRSKIRYVSLFAFYLALFPFTAKAEGVELPLTLEKTSPDLLHLVSEQSKLVRLYDKGIWTEGPVEYKDGSILFSDIPNNVLLRYSPGKGVTEFLKPSQFQNGHAMDRKGKLLAASHGKRTIECLEKNGKWQVLVDLYGHKKFNSPNDLVVDRDGEIWFTDPSFGIDFPREGYGGNPVMGGEYSYRYNPRTHTLRRLETPEVATPNGIAFSPDYRTLYISESQLGHDPKDKNLHSGLVAYDLNPDKSLKNERLLANIKDGTADGIKVDREGRIWVAAGKHVEIFTPDGQKIGAIDLPEIAGNLLITYDKKGKKTLFVTASRSLYKIDLE